MLKIWIVFDLDYESEWFEDEFVQQMILDIDKIKWISGSVFESPVLGIISPRELSGGVKSLILAYKDVEGTRMFATSCWGDNCAKWVSKISFYLSLVFSSLIHFYSHLKSQFVHKNIQRRIGNSRIFIKG